MSSGPSTASTSSSGLRQSCVRLTLPSQVPDIRTNQLLHLCCGCLQEVVARVGRRREQPESSNAAAAAGDDNAMDVDPSAASTSTATASHPNGQQPEASTSVAVSGSSKPAAAKAKSAAAPVLVGPELDRALDRGDDLEVSWPFRGPDAWSDWRGIEALWCGTSRCPVDGTLADGC